MTDTDNARALAALREARKRGITYATCDDAEQDTLIAALELVERVRVVGEVWTEVIPEDWGRHERQEITRVKWLGDPPPAGTKLAALPIDTTGAAIGRSG